MMDSIDSMPPEVTIEPADNGFMVRHYRRSSKKDEDGKTVRQVASTAEEALGHARKVLGGSTKISKKKSIRGDGASVEGAIGEHAMNHAHSSRASGRRRRPRAASRRA
jgi:hypothetical protein